MKISNTAIDRPIATFMVMSIVIILGITTLFKMPVELFPNMEMPVVTITTKYIGASPQEIETQITKVLEDELASLNNLDTVSSVSQQDVSTIMVQFNWGTNLDIAALDVKDKVDKIRINLPADLTEEPVIEKADPTASPILQYSLSGEADLGTLYNIADQEIRPQLEKIKGVSSVKIVGGRENEIKVYLDPDQLQNYGLSIPVVIDTIKKDSRNFVIGKVDQGEKELSIRTKGEINSLDDLKKLTFNLPTGGQVSLQDFANIELGYLSTSEQTYFNGKNAVGIFVYKLKSANTVEVSKLVRGEAENLVKQIPADIKVDTILDSSEFIDASIKNLTKDGLIGALLATAILYLFLGRISSTLVVGLAIPTSIITTFLFMYMFGLSINLITLGALGLAIGMMVDDAVVVLQNIFRHYHDEGRGVIEAAKMGVQEVGTAVIASTITKVIVFLPMIFVTGLAGQIFMPLAITVTIGLLSSLAVSLTVTPMLSGLLLKQSKHENGKLGSILRILQRASDFIHIYIQKLENLYLRTLKWSLGHRKRILFLALVFLIGGFGFIPMMGAEFMPKMDSGEFSVEVEMPSGTKVEKTDQVVRSIMKQLQDIPEMDKMFITMGTDKKSNVKIDRPDYAIFDVKLIDQSQRKRKTKEILDDLRTSFSRYPGVQIKAREKGFIASSLFSSDPVFVMIKGDDENLLRQTSDQILQIVKNTPGTREPRTSFTQGKPEVQLLFDRDKIKEYGIDLMNISLTMRAAVNGEVVTQYRNQGDQLDIRLLYPESRLLKLSDFENITVFSPKTGSYVPLQELAQVIEANGPSTIYRENKLRMAYITSDIVGRDLNSVNQDIMKEISKVELPRGFSIEFGGESKDMSESFGQLGFALLLAIVLIYMVMASEFESLKHPFVIMFSLPLTFFGVTASLSLTGRSLSVPALLGVLQLIGIVVGNAIILIEYTNQLRRSGHSVYSALLKAGPVRLQPILMTTSAMVLGLLPLAMGLGEGAETHAPMATVVVGGLTVSTLLTLYVIPVIYSIAEGQKPLRSQLMGDEEVLSG